jgi:hypothetical protein
LIDQAARGGISPANRRQHGELAVGLAPRIPASRDESGNIDKWDATDTDIEDRESAGDA